MDRSVQDSSSPGYAPPRWPERFNLCEYFLDHNLEEGRADKVCLTDEHGQATYAELSERARRAAAAMRARGLRPEERVLFVLSDRIEFAEAWFGCLRAGGVFAMVNPLSKRAQLEYYLRYTQARIVVTEQATLPELLEAACEAPLCEHLLVVDAELPAQAADGVEVTRWADALAAEDPAGPRAELADTGPGDLAGWLFTSGSTGEPKACVHVHSDFAYSTETYALQVAGYREDDVCLSVPKLFFGYATGTNLMFPFRVGASVVLFSGRSTADALFDHIAEHRPTFLTSVPTLINNMLRSPRAEGFDLSSLRVCLSAGEALPARVYEEWKERTGVEILDGIGSAEMFRIYISNAPGDVRLGSLGRLVPGYDAEIVDPEGTPVAAGEPGLLRVRGGSTALSYWGDKAKSNATFQGEWCTTADVFRRDADGYFFYEGRDDDLLKVSGIWVSPLEIEDCLLRHDAVDEVCVVGRQDETGLVKPHAYVVPTSGRAGCDELAAELKSHVKAHLAPYKYPRWFEWRAELPKNDRGKVARKLLRDCVDDDMTTRVVSRA